MQGFSDIIDYIPCAVHYISVTHFITGHLYIPKFIQSSQQPSEVGMFTILIFNRSQLRVKVTHNYVKKKSNLGSVSQERCF